MRVAAALRRNGLPGNEMPDADPLDGGTMARLLFLLENPGPGNVAHARWRGFRQPEK
ncbi:hypothetical protein MWU52_00010 [Jannaschia sp. S6380]|uniref:hypothetical protein n=1 Tax=Jannaschia sp. S6380 TaxID=2926408 RepID=UPI001FF37D69|nr:hypothetical protein [Jannaschia sp. S6380]MCK0165923.1 hypothetical protein [Jannaschia sp. S6380]